MFPLLAIGAAVAAVAVSQAVQSAPSASSAEAPRESLPTPSEAIGPSTGASAGAPANPAEMINKIIV